MRSFQLAFLCYSRLDTPFTIGINGRLIVEVGDDARVIVPAEVNL
jgi:hypothetical protein